MSRWFPGTEIPALRDRRDGETGFTSQWSGWLWLVERDTDEPWPGWYERNPVTEGWVMDGELGVDVRLWASIAPYPALHSWPRRGL